MNVFVLTTGRSGSVTFSRACRHITNYTSGHETRSRIVDGRLDYPGDHIEVDPRLAWWLGTMDRKYPKAFYVWLRRDPEAVAASTAKRTGPNTAISNWPNVAYWKPTITYPQAARAMVESIEDNIRLFLKDRDYQTVRIENPAGGFRYFWQKVGAVGDFNAALAEFSHRYNAS